MNAQPAERTMARIVWATIEFLFWLFLFLIPLHAADNPTPSAITEKDYRVFRGDGQPATLADIISAAQQVNVTFLGESHDDSVAHYLELEILKRLASPDSVLSLEMFERDTQEVVNEYLAGWITEKYLISDGRAWSNYKTDYRPLIEFAKEKKIPVVAANAPARYVNRVSRLGQGALASLDETARKNLPPLPYADASPQYAEKFRREMEEMEKESGGKGKSGSKTKAGKTPSPESATHADEGFALESQTLWDATMAYSIASTLEQSPNARILQINGLFHSEQRLGILDHLARYRPKTTSLVVIMATDKTFPAWHSTKLKEAGDFVIITDPSLPRSFSDTSETSGKTQKRKKQKDTQK